MKSRAWNRLLVAGGIALGYPLAACGGSEDTAAQTQPAKPPATPAKSSDPPGVIAYQTNRGGKEGVWLIGSDGSDDREVVTDVPDMHLHPDWSPDGSRLLFTKRADIDLLFESDASAPRSARQIVSCEIPCVGDDEASYSPDGRRIAFIRALGPLADDRPSDCGLWTFDLGTKKATRLTRHRGCRTREAFPRWSPDGSTLVFFRDRTDASNVTSTTAVFSRPARGGRERQLTPWELAGGDPDWSPDGKLIVFSTHPLVYFQRSGVSNLFTIRPDGSGRRQLTSYADGGLRASQPRWTPDGDGIVYVTDTGSTRELWQMRSDGSDLKQITAGGIYTHPVWKPGS